MTTLGTKILQQPDTRRADFFEDQHGRVWHAEIDIRTGDEVGGFYAQGWTAPAAPHWCRERLLPDKKFLKVVRELRKAPRLMVDYDLWLRDWDNAVNLWTLRLREVIKGMSGGNAGIEAEWIDNPPPNVMQATGDHPRVKTPREFIEAMAEGNQWALGLTEKVPSWAVPILDRWALDQPRPVTGIGSVKQGAYPDADEEVEADDRFGGIEEEADPDALGGKKIPVARPRGRPRTKTT